MFCTAAIISTAASMPQTIISEAYPLSGVATDRSSEQSSVKAMKRTCADHLPLRAALYTTSAASSTRKSASGSKMNEKMNRKTIRTSGIHIARLRPSR